MSEVWRENTINPLSQCAVCVDGSDLLFLEVSVVLLTKVLGAWKMERMTPRVSLQALLTVLCFAIQRSHVATIDAGNFSHFAP